MAIPKTKNIRGLQNIRSRSGMADQTTEPYRAFLRIGALEMEKARRGKERESAMLRVKAIDERFREIEAEKAELLKIVLPGNLIGVGGADKKNRPGSNQNRISEGFKISY